MIHSPESDSPPDYKTNRFSPETKDLILPMDADEKYAQQVREELYEGHKLTKDNSDDEQFMNFSSRSNVKNPRFRYSTTSSVYAEHTISNPNNDQMLYCIGAIVQAQIFEDDMNPDLRRDLHPEFLIDVKLSPELGGPRETIPEQILNHESMNDEELRVKLLNGSVPTVDTLYRFFSLLDCTARYSAECNIIALIYVNRMTAKNKLALTMQNWRGLWVAGIILAQKICDDNPLKTASFARILPSVSKSQLRILEMTAFQLLDFNANVKASTYAKYYFELHSLFVEIAGQDPRFLWKMKPMTIAQSMKLELRTLKASTEPTATPSTSTTVTTTSKDDSSLEPTAASKIPSKLSYDAKSNPGRSTEPTRNSSLGAGAKKTKTAKDIMDEMEATRKSNSRFVLS